ncbi:MAG: methyl-accepting chemotaxis protein [Oscillospiraceae bacterium]|jgi:X-X-X-Leu-X-X-Gly heptad repeat protein|nr:methyl-accepting chemotaxis protein [Oscillospiraceae bacterium]
MKKLFAFKKLSLKFAFIVGTTVVIVAGAVAAYMESRIITEIGKFSRLDLRYQTLDLAEECNYAFKEAAYAVAGLRRFAEANFDTRAYQNDASAYFDDEIKTPMEGFIINTITESDFITGAYFAVHPDLAGYPLVNEVFFENTARGIQAAEPQTYDEYKQTSSADMEWFYGAYSSGKAYWSSIYAWTDGTVMVSYSEPVLVSGAKVGIAGVDISIGHINDLVKDIKLYETGFALIRDNYGEFFETGEFIKNLDDNGKKALSETAKAGSGDTYGIKLNGVDYLDASGTLFNDYEIYVLAPKNEVNAEIYASIMRFVIIFVVALTMVIFIAYFIGKNISKPLAALSAFMRRAALTGDIRLRPEDASLTEKYALIEDETGQTTSDCLAFVNHVSHISEELETVAGGDLTVDIELISDTDVMGKSLNHMVDKLSALFSDVHNSTVQVANGSKQIADGAQALAAGSTQQASAIAELSVSTAEISTKTKKNAEMASRAAEFGDLIMKSAEKGGLQMKEMVKAVNEINQASQSISKVIKAIDDIAFQTNILALNAAVEAARAGDAGKGFAVVAEEVRNLAAKSAEAAKNTGELISDSIGKAELGARIAGETSASFEEIVSGIGESTTIVKEIARYSQEQSNGISQINTGIEQVTQVVQQNSATAQQSAAASQQMNGQSEMLETLISQFKLKSSS